jgi:TRAP-type C4-dicarboxylate transport system substrate-binding protein
MIFLTVFLMVAVAFAHAQTPKKYVLKFNHVLTTQDPYHAAFLKSAEAVSARTNGNLKIEVFPSAQLGVEEDILEQIRQGANVGQNTDAARLGQYVPAIAVMNGPYFVETLDEVQKLNTLPSVQGWMAELEKTQGFKVLSFMWVQGFRQMLTNKPVRKPSDLSGLRIRTPPAPIWQESIRAIAPRLSRWPTAICTQGSRPRRSMASNSLLPRVPRASFRRSQSTPARLSIYCSSTLK